MHRIVFEIVFISIKQSKVIKNIPGLFYWGKMHLGSLFLFYYFNNIKGDIANMIFVNGTVIGRNYINDILGYLLMIFKALRLLLK